jgi:hypothetical protein
MKLHFGSTAEKEGLLIDFQEMKREYQRYENWQPTTRIIKGMTQEPLNDHVESMTKTLIEKTKQ